jgi:hypothetical protein
LVPTARCYSSFYRRISNQGRRACTWIVPTVPANVSLVCKTQCVRLITHFSPSHQYPPKPLSTWTTLDAMSSFDCVGNSFPTGTLSTTSRFQSDNLRSSLSTFASSPGSTSPSRRYITWLTRSSSLLMAQLQTVGCRATISTALCNLASFSVSDTLNLLLPIPLHPSIRYLRFNNQVRDIMQIQLFCRTLCGTPQ